MNKGYTMESKNRGLWYFNKPYFGIYILVKQYSNLQQDNLQVYPYFWLDSSQK